MVCSRAAADDFMHHSTGNKAGIHHSRRESLFDSIDYITSAKTNICFTLFSDTTRPPSQSNTDTAPSQPSQPRIKHPSCYRRASRGFPQTSNKHVSLAWLKRSKGFDMEGVPDSMTTRSARFATSMHTVTCCDCARSSPSCRRTTSSNTHHQSKRFEILPECVHGVLNTTRHKMGWCGVVPGWVPMFVTTSDAGFGHQDLATALNTHPMRCQSRTPIPIE